MGVTRHVNGGISSVSMVDRGRWWAMGGGGGITVGGDVGRGVGVVVEVEASAK